MRHWQNLSATLYVIVLYGFIFLPIFTLVLFSFQEGRFPIPPFNGPSLKWYHAVFADNKLTAALLNSLYVALISSLIAVVLGFVAAYGFARYRLPGASILRGFITAPLTVSYLIIGFGLLISFNLFGISRSLLAVSIGHIVINTPLCFALVFAAMSDHQQNIERAARDLGANDWQVIFWVTLPVLMPSLLAAFFLSVTLSWDEFIIAFLLSRFDVTLPVEIWSLLRSGLNPKTNAVGSVVFLISVVIVLILEFTILRKVTRR